jgi:glycerol-3-phosphate dehydrogenase
MINYKIKGAYVNFSKKGIFYLFMIDFLLFDFVTNNIEFPNLFIHHFFILFSMKGYQVAIIGGGVIGSAISRELSKYKLDIVVFEKGSDVASGSSKANSGVIHSGINSPPSSLKAKHCVEGNKMFGNLAKDLGFSLKWTGKWVIAKNEEEVRELERLKEVGTANRVQDLEIREVSKIKKREPNISCSAALWVPTAGIISPYEFTIALAENAVENNTKFLLETRVTGIKKHHNGFLIKTDKGNFRSEIVVNAAGINCKEIVTMVEEPDFRIYPCRGEYLVLDKKYRNLINAMIYPLYHQ